MWHPVDLAVGRSIIVVRPPEMNALQELPASCLPIKSCIFPDDWKTTKVTPLFKEGSKSDPNNYRPISVLPFASTKITEKVISA